MGFRAQGLEFRVWCRLLQSSPSPNPAPDPNLKTNSSPDVKASPGPTQSKVLHYPDRVPDLALHLTLTLALSVMMRTVDAQASYKVYAYQLTGRHTLMVCVVQKVVCGGSV